MAAQVKTEDKNYATAEKKWRTLCEESFKKCQVDPGDNSARLQMEYAKAQLVLISIKREIDANEALL